MYCKKGIYVNWGNIPNLEFDFGPVNLFSGGNGSGKTTAADGIQSLMTAAYENLFTYNPGQDETTQKGRGGKQVRTLASYVLGCDDGSFARLRTSDGYIAGIFHPTQGETGDPFTAVMAVRASLDKAGNMKQARQDDILFLIIPNEELSIQHFVKEYKDGAHVVPLTDIATLLKKEFGNNAVETYDKKSQYLRRLYGALRGQKGAVSDREAKHAARTFSNFMAYKPVKSINEFVAKEVLDPKDLTEDIKQVSELMKTIHGMEAETRSVKESIENLEAASQHGQQYIENWINHCVTQYTEKTRQLIVKQQEYLNKKNEQRQTKDNLGDTETRLKSNEEKKSALHKQLVELEAQRQGIGALKDKDQLEKEIDTIKLQLAEQAKPLLNQNYDFAQNVQHSQNLQKQVQSHSISVYIPAFDSKAFRKCLNTVISTGSDTGIDAQKLFNADWVGIGDLESRLDKLLDLQTAHRELFNALHDTNQNQRSLRDQVLSLVDQRKEQQNKIHQQIHSKQAEINRLENHRASYPPYVQAALEAIHTQCPQAQPAVLCDFVEVLDSKWQMAIEGYIGGNRFSIIVEPEFEAEAISILRNMKGKRNNARVIQGHKVQRDAEKVRLPSDSIVDIMAFDHKIVEYYIKATYGNVVRVPNEEALKSTARGITANGLGSGGYSMFRCDIDDADLVFGQGARERALNAKHMQLNTLSEQSQQVESDYRNCAEIGQIIDSIRPIHFADIVKNMLGLFRNLQNSEHRLSNLDLSDFSDLENALIALQEEHKETEKLSKQINENIGQLTTRLEQIDRQIEILSKEQDLLQEDQESQEQNVLNISKVHADFDDQAALTEAEERAKLAKHDFNFSYEIQDYVNGFTKAERDLHERVLHHNQSCNSYNAISYFTGNNENSHSDFFKAIAAIKRDIDNVHNSLKNNVLVDKHEKLTSLKESFNTAFVTNLCHSIYQSINDGKRILEELNKELEHHRFGADQERFYFDYQWVPEFYEYHRFFKELIDTPNLGDGSTLFEAELSEKSKTVRDRLLTMLLDKDEQQALRDLKRISDYRHYREYEIYKEPLGKNPIPLSKYGTGSGGQLETPAYIIRSAAVTSAFRFNEGNTHCRMVLVDEAFSKMDETRSREVINYLTETLGLQLIFIMPTSKSGPFMDLISNQIVFSKCPTDHPVGELKTRVLVDRKECNQENIAQLWANHRKAVRHQASLDFMEEFV